MQSAFGVDHTVSKSFTNLMPKLDRVMASGGSSRQKQRAMQYAADRLTRGEKNLAVKNKLRAQGKLKRIS
jgi:hypothetical protein